MGWLSDENFQTPRKTVNSERDSFLIQNINSFGAETSEILVSREFSRIFFSFSLLVLNLEPFQFHFHFSKKSEGILFFIFHFSKKVKAIHISLFFLEKKE